VHFLMHTEHAKLSIMISMLVFFMVILVDVGLCYVIWWDLWCQFSCCPQLRRYMLTLFVSRLAR
jgi:hypothetical protein